MKVFFDKQIKHFGIFLITFTLLLFISGTGLIFVQTRALQSLFLNHNNAVATSLLEQGVSQQVIAQAISSKTISADGAVFLQTIGLSEHTAARFLPVVDQFRQISQYIILPGEAILSLVILGGCLLFLWKRDQLYVQGAKVITNYTEGNFSCHLPQMKEGTIYSLFTSVDQLAEMLQSKNEAGQKAKMFLKKTISDISHQLKTPLAALILYNEIIYAEPDNAETVRAYSQKTSSALKRIEELIQAMLKITRLDSGSIIFEKESCPLHTLIDQSIRELTTRADSEGKKIIMDDSPADIVLCDRQWTSEAIGNIVKNALDHTDQGGTIHISWKQTPAMLRILITDNGSGIHPEDLHHIFKRFYRSKKSLDIQGAGLGLSLAKSIIEGQGGVISVQSTLNKGTVFTISFLTES